MSLRILSFGAGVDSSALLIYHLFVRSLKIDHVVFSDTGAELPPTYRNLRRFQALCAAHNIPFTKTSRTIERLGRRQENIYQWLTRNGCIPLMPGSTKHVCSARFKGDVIDAWANRIYPKQPITFLIGIEFNEKNRVKRFTPPKNTRFSYEYPLIDLQMDRAACQTLLRKHGLSVQKSSCYCCPFMTVEEIRNLITNHPDQWREAKNIEKRFAETSPIKHQAWLDAGMPLNGAGNCARGHWKHDSFARGARLYAKSVNGKQLSVDEWLFDEFVLAGGVAGRC